jgi:hypothetical protein
MKLVPDAHVPSFYETFSDLIFCTLILFVLLVMALVTQVQTRVDVALAPGEFTGATGRSRMFIAFVPVGGRTHIAFVPSDLAIDFFLARAPGQDPLLDLCERVARGESFGMIDADSFVDLAPGLSAPLAEEIVSLAEAGAAISLLLELRDSFPEIASDAARSRRMLCGEHTTLNARTVGPDLAPSYRRWQEWASALGEREDQVHSRHTQTVAPLRAGAFRDDGDGRVRFRVTGADQVRIGRTELDAAQFLAMLRSIAPGRGFRVEFVPEDGARPMPPAWILDRVLTPAGIDARTIASPRP